MTDAKPDDVDMETWDSARRMMDAVNLHVLAMTESGRDRPGFVAIRLSDGRSPDGVLYDSRRECVRYQPNNDVFPCQVEKMNMSAKEAVTVLKFARMAFRNGVIFAEEAPILPQLSELVPRGQDFPRVDLSKWGRKSD